jgi:hypothetical protein
VNGKTHAGGGTAATEPATEANGLWPGWLEPLAGVGVGVDMLPGRNDSWVTRSDGGSRFFVKRFAGQADDARLRMCRSLAFERFCAGQAADISPRMVWCDEPNLLMVSEFIADMTTGADLITTSDYGTDFAARAGRVIGALHALGNGGFPELAADDVPPALPSAELLRGMPLSLFRDCSAGELKAWRLMQQDALLVEAVDRLLDQAARAPRVPAHCDLRLDQFLVSPDRLYVIDWEEFRMADAARDVGSFAGEWAYHAVTAWAGPGSEPMSEEDVVRHCANGIEEARPAIAAFWAGYRDVFAAHDPSLAARSTAFAGWHMFDRMIASARHGVRLSAVQRAAAGIGRGMMTAPDEAASVIGLTGG